MENQFERTAVRVSNVSIIANALLSGIKLFAGIFAHSGAMVSDAVHSASDVFSSIIVIIGVKLAAKESDEDHQYGHERIESVAALILAMVLIITGIFIGHSAVENLTRESDQSMVLPGFMALVAAVVSIVCKEAMYWYTRYYAKKIDSTALMADAWHHRSDALSSVGSLIGIEGARQGLWWFDPVASLIICVFILKAAYDIAKDALQKMVDHAASTQVRDSIIACAQVQPGVEGVEQIQTREFGNRIYVDISLYANGDLTLKESNQIAEQVHDAIEKEFPKIKHIVVVIKPS